MKSFAFLLCILAGSTTAATAGERSTPWTVGARAGLQIANVWGGDVFNNSTSYGAAGGIFARYALNDRWLLQSEALFTMRGASYEAGGIETEQKINTIEVPLLVGAAVMRGHTVKPTVFLGPDLGFLLSNKFMDGAEIDVENASKTVDIGVVGGADAEYGLGGATLLLDVRYSLGLTSIYEGSYDTDVKNRGLSITLGYGVHL